MAVDPRSGEELWERDDFPTGADLMCGLNHVLITPLGGPTSVLLRALDGNRMADLSALRLEQRQPRRLVMTKPKIVVQEDVQGNRFLAITCPDCGHENRYAFSGLSPDIQLPCKCGVGFNFSQQNYDDLQRNFGLGDEDETVQ